MTLCRIPTAAKKRKLTQLSDSTPEKPEKSENVPDNAQIVVKRKNACHVMFQTQKYFYFRVLTALTVDSWFSFPFKTQEEKLFHKKVEPVTKPAAVKSSNAEEEAAEKVGISSPSKRDSDKV